MKRTALLLLAAGLAACGGVVAEESAGMVTTETIEYRHGATVLEGYVGVPKGSGDLPAVLVVHAWKGIGPHERQTVERLAKDGYVAFALDMYGKGIRPKTNEEAAKQAGIYRGDRNLMRERAKAGLEWLRKHRNDGDVAHYELAVDKSGRASDVERALSIAQSVLCSYRSQLWDSK